MKLITKTLEHNHNLFLFSCKHEGSILSSDKGWDKLCNMLNSEYEGVSANYGIDFGDMIEAISVDDPRFSQEKLEEPLIIEQMNIAVKKREPIAEKILYILMGNHELKQWRVGNITKEACKRLGVEYGTYAAKLTVKDSNSNLMYKLFSIHGRKTINSTADDPKRRRANMELILKRQLKFKFGDCAIMAKGHAHKLLVCEPEAELYLTDDGKKIKQGYTSWGQTEEYIHPDARWYACVGSFLRLYGKDISGYAEIAEYDPVELGFVIVIVRNKRIQKLVKYPIKF